MLIDKHNEDDWLKLARTKLDRFLTRVPLWTKAKYSNKDFGVYIYFDNKKLFYPYKCQMDVKSWIHHIKEDLVKYYPRLVEDIVENHVLTPAEQALYIEKHGGDINSVPVSEVRIIKQNCWRVDKVLLHKEIFILVLEGTVSNPTGESVFVPSDEPISRRYKYDGTAALFMKKLRSSICDQDKSKDFFENTTPLDNLLLKDE